jgi:dihydrofolate reductase
MRMKLVAAEFVTLDGVYQGPGAPTEDTRGGFDRGGWQAPFGDEQTDEFITQVYSGMDAMLLGRTTFDIWESYWPHHDAGDPVSHGINVVPKYVPSTTRTDSTWQNTHFIGGDLEAKVRELKAQPGRDLLLQGSGVLLQWLLERDLVDQLNLVIYPLVLGEGFRLFPDKGKSHRLEVVSSTPTDSGAVIQIYKPTGRATFGTVGE